MGHRVTTEILKQMRKLGYTHQTIADMVGKDRLTVVKQLAPDANPTIATLSDYEEVLEGELHFLTKDVVALLATNDIEQMREMIKIQTDTINSLHSTIAIKDAQMMQYMRSIERYESSIAIYQDYIRKLTNQIYDIVMSFEGRNNTTHGL